MPCGFESHLSHHINAEQKFFCSAFYLAFCYFVNYNTFSFYLRKIFFYRLNIAV